MAVPFRADLQPTDTSAAAVDYRTGCQYEDEQLADILNRIPLRAYKRFQRETYNPALRGLMPDIANMPPADKVALVIFGIRLLLLLSIELYKDQSLENWLYEELALLSTLAPKVRNNGPLSNEENTFITALRGGNHDLWLMKLWTNLTMVRGRSGRQ